MTVPIASMTREERIDAIRELLATESDLGFLGTVNEATLEMLHDLIAEYVHRTHDAMKPVYVVMAQATRFIPKFVLVRMARPIPAYVMAHSTLHLESKSSASLGAAMGVDRMAEIQHELARMGAFQKIGEISDHTPVAVLAELAARNENSEQQAKIAMHMRDSNRIRMVLKAIPESRRTEVFSYLEAHGRQDLAERFR